MRPRSIRTIAEATLSAITGVLAVVTMFWRNWIEAIFGLDLDNGTGWVEWLLIATLASLSATLATKIAIKLRRVVIIAPALPHDGRL